MDSITSCSPVTGEQFARNIIRLIQILRPPTSSANVSTTFENLESNLNDKINSHKDYLFESDPQKDTDIIFLTPIAPNEKKWTRVRSDIISTFSDSDSDENKKAELLKIESLLPSRFASFDRVIEFGRILVKLGFRLDIPVIDLLLELPQGWDASFYASDGLHPSPLGHVWVAKYIQACIARHYPKWISTEIAWDIQSIQKCILDKQAKEEMESPDKNNETNSQNNNNSVTAESEIEENHNPNKNSILDRVIFYKPPPGMISIREAAFRVIEYDMESKDLMESIKATEGQLPPALLLPGGLSKEEKFKKAERVSKAAYSENSLKKKAQSKDEINPDDPITKTNEQDGIEEKAEEDNEINVDNDTESRLSNHSSVIRQRNALANIDGNLHPRNNIQLDHDTQTMVLNEFDPPTKLLQYAQAAVDRALLRLNCDSPTKLVALARQERNSRSDPTSFSPVRPPIHSNFDASRSNNLAPQFARSQPNLEGVHNVVPNQQDNSVKKLPNYTYEETERRNNFQMQQPPPPQGYANVIASPSISYPQVIPSSYSQPRRYSVGSSDFQQQQIAQQNNQNQNNRYLNTDMQQQQLNNIPNQQFNSSPFEMKPRTDFTKVVQHQQQHTYNHQKAMAMMNQNGDPGYSKLYATIPSNNFNSDVKQTNGYPDNRMTSPYPQGNQYVNGSGVSSGGNNGTYNASTGLTNNNGYSINKVTPPQTVKPEAPFSTPSSYTTGNYAQQQQQSHQIYQKQQQHMRDNNDQLHRMETMDATQHYRPDLLSNTPQISGIPKVSSSTRRLNSGNNNNTNNKPMNNGGINNNRLVGVGRAVLQPNAQ